MRRVIRKLASIIVLAAALAAPASAHADATLAVTGGAATLTGDGGNNTLVAVDLGGGLGVFFGDANGATNTPNPLTAFPAICVPLSGAPAPFPGVACTGITSVTINGGAGADQLAARPELDGSFLNGGTGADTLIGGLDDETFSGGADADQVAYVAPEGAGIDRTAGVTASLPATAAATTTGNGTTGESDTIRGDVEGLIGGQGNDTLTGNGAVNTLAGAAPPGTAGVATTPAGTDTIVAGGGNDTVLAGDRGSVSGGDGNDQVVGGRDTGATTIVSGGIGDDTLVSGLGDDALAGGAGADTVAYASVTAAGLNRALNGVTVDLAAGTGGQTAGGLEQDTIATDIETVAGSNGGDVLQGSSRAETIAGAVPPNTPGVTSTPAGNDAITGGDGADTLLGGDTGSVAGQGGNDQVVGGRSTAGTTVVTGGIGDDSVVSNTGKDDLSGGEGDDALAYASVALAGINRTTGVTLVLPDPGAPASTGNGGPGEGDLIRGDFETLAGSNGSDSIKGNNQSNTLAGVAPAGTAGVTPGPPGNDTFEGGAGADFMLGSTGNDTFRTRDGTKDTAIVCAAGTDSVVGDAVDTVGADCENVDGATRTGGTPPRPTTPTGPTVPTKPGTSGKDRTRPKITVTPRKLKLRKGRRVRVFVRCRNERKGCRGTVRLRLGKKTLAKKTFRIKGKKRKRVTLRLSRKAVKRLNARGRTPITIRVKARDKSGNRRTKSVKGSLKR